MIHLFNIGQNQHKANKTDKRPTDGHKIGTNVCLSRDLSICVRLAKTKTLFQHSTRILKLLGVFEVARELRENEPTTNMYEMFKIPLFSCENSFNTFECTVVGLRR